jgi:hypothetical protein
LTLCGTISYQLIGGNTSYLAYNASNRVLTFTPRTTSLIGIENIHSIRATSPNYPLNIAESPFKTEGLAACAATAYDPNRLAIKVQPALEKYNIKIVGPETLTLPFTFDI